MRDTIRLHNSLKRTISLNQRVPKKPSSWETGRSDIHAIVFYTQIHPFQPIVIIKHHIIISLEKSTIQQLCDKLKKYLYYACIHFLWSKSWPCMLLSTLFFSVELISLLFSHHRTITTIQMSSSSFLEISIRYPTVHEQPVIVALHIHTGIPTCSS